MDPCYLETKKGNSQLLGARKKSVILLCYFCAFFLFIYIIIYIINILDRCRASRERSERDLSDRMAFWPAQLNAALRCMANSITVLWLS